MRKHEGFILTPITKILEEATYSTSNIEMSIDTYPVSDYIMQSLFLKMTGFQEQKVKCILWELATDDYGLRYERYRQNPLGECSSLKEKNHVLSHLADQLDRHLKGSHIIDDEKKKEIVNETKGSLLSFYNDSHLKSWLQKSFLEYEQLLGNCTESCILFISTKNIDLLGHCDNCPRKHTAPEESICKLGNMKALYDAMIAYRNRCAHNTISYQQNLPSLESMIKPEFFYENYFARFFCLIFIDKIFIILFKRYLEQHPEPFIL